LFFAFLALAFGALPNPRTGELRLIEFNATTRVWLTPKQVDKLSECAPGQPENTFMDITDFQHLGDPNPNMITLDVPDRPAFESVVRPLLEYLQEEQLTAYVTRLSAFPTRRYTSQSGEDAVDYLISEYRRHSAHRTDVVIEKFRNTFVQSSIIARIQGEGPQANELVLIGGHVDSISNGNVAPGADDDATGSSTVLEIFRVLASQNFKPKRTIEFHGYAGEEAGLLGSQAMATRYKAEGKVIAGMMQLDMTGYVRAGTNPTVGVVTDFTDPQLSAFVRQLVDTYTEATWQDTRCGYGCSDHASWNKAGYRSSFPFEGLFANSNPRIHTATDLVQYLRPDHMYEFAKLGLSFVVELSLAE